MATILLVDDNPQQLHALQDVLQALGYAVQTALNGVEALAIIRQQRPDLILSDILMPEMDGFTLCRTLKQDSAWADIPFVFLTAAYSDEEDREFGLRLGAARFIVRPIKMAGLAAALCEVLDQCQHESVPSDAPAIDDQEEYLQQYSAAVVRRLEDHVAELEVTNQALQREIAERKQVEAALQASEQNLLRLIEHSPVAMGVILVEEQKMLLLNKKSVELLGYTLAEIADAAIWWERVYPDETYREELKAEWLRRMADAAARQGVMELLEARVTCKDGTERCVQFHAAPLGDQIIMTLIDLTEQKQTEKALQESEQRLLQLIEHLPVAMVVASGAEGQMLFMNQQFTALFGYTNSDMPDVDRWWPLAYPDETYREEQRRKWINRTAAALEDQTAMEPRESVVTCKDGTVRHIQFHTALIGDQLIVSFVDLTAQKHTEEALRKAEQEKTVVLNSMSDLVTYQDRDMCVIWANQAAGISVGLPSESLVGKQCYEIWGQRGDPCEGCPVILARDTGQPHEAEIITPDGRIWSVRGYPVHDAQGQVEGMVEFVTDITERKWTEQKQLEFAVERERANILLRFIGDASHDLRTPLTTIKANLYLLDKVDLAGDTARYVGEIDRQAARLEKLLDDMLSMSRLDATIEFELQCVDLNALVRSVVDQYRSLARDKQHTLRFVGMADLPPVTVDQTHFRRAVSNLLVNALHYTADGGRITVRTGAHEVGVYIDVTDSGFGIGTDDLPHIFKQFYRADKARGTVRGGAGLGLTIAQKIVDTHEGRIEVDTVLGEGSTFRIVLPLGERDA